MAVDKSLKDQDLGENDDEEEFAFPPAERRVITQPLERPAALSSRFSSIYRFLSYVSPRRMKRNTKSSTAINASHR